MQFQIVNAGKQRAQTYIKCLIYGDSGAGKSFLAATSPKPLILLTEPNGQASIMHSNPNADLIHINSVQTLWEVLRDIRDNPKNWTKYNSLVIDSLSEVQRLFKDELTGHGRNTMKLQDWGKPYQFSRYQLLPRGKLSLPRLNRKRHLNICEHWHLPFFLLKLLAELKSPRLYRWEL